RPRPCPRARPGPWPAPCPRHRTRARSGPRRPSSWGCTRASDVAAADPGRTLTIAEVALAQRATAEVLDQLEADLAQLGREPLGVEAGHHRLPDGGHPGALAIERDGATLRIELARIEIREHELAARRGAARDGLQGREVRFAREIRGDAEPGDERR